ncbi:MAG: class II fumarate hydratase [Puniceicoccales bacterium]|jgi:fumarate hydratase class II|nr:class II fumarate hydratase [Puniceicoccales bacterium]
MVKIVEDSMGMVEIPDDKLYGAFTQRTLNTCSISGHRVPLELISAILLIKKACAIANCKLGKLSEDKKSAILGSIDLLLTGNFNDNFVLDIFQNGAGTSTHMNVNEVIASISRQKFNATVHQNDDVNMSQSTNDVMPSAINISCSLQIRNHLLPSLQAMFAVLSAHAEEWKDVVKIGRTHLQDAVPMTLGQEFSAYAQQINKCIGRCFRAIEILGEIPMGGTAVGTGLNSPKGFSALVIEEINGETELNFTVAVNKFCEQSSKDSLVEISGIVNSMTSALAKIACDLKLLSSGPRTGLRELSLPETQAGSSIMPGKVNPIMCEMLLQACHYINGMMLTVLLGANNGELQLNTAMPLLAYALLDSINILANCANNFSRYCLKDLRPNVKILDENSKKSLMLITAIAPLIGYEMAASIVKEAIEQEKTIAEILRDKHLLDPKSIDSLCDPKNMLAS